MSDSATSWRALSWHCENCDCDHGFTSRRALTPFKKACGYRFNKTASDGDCFYRSVGTCTNRTVLQLRELVSKNFDEGALDFYRVLARCDGAEYDWAVALKKSGVLTNIDTIRTALLREGSIVGCDGCIWADSFAIATVGETLDINILGIYMARSTNESPYRFLHRATVNSRYVVLKFQSSHYQPLMYNGRPIHCRLVDLPESIRTLWNL